MNACNGEDYSKALIRVTFLFKDGTRKNNLKLKLYTRFVRNDV